MRKDNPLADFQTRITEGERLLGMFTGMTDAATTYMMGSAGLDYVIIDNEHSPMSWESALHHVRAAEATGLVPMVRVARNDQLLIQRALDIGCQGIVVPHVETGADAERAVAATRLAPNGTRGMCPGCNAVAYDSASWSEFAAKANTDTFIVAIIESRAGVASINEIASVDGVGIVYFGPGDLSQELESRAQGWESEELQDAWVQVREATMKMGKLLMTGPYPTRSAEVVDALYAQGANLVSYSLDVVVLRSVINDIAALKRTKLNR